MHITKRHNCVKAVFTFITLMVLSCTGNDIEDPNSSALDPQGTITLDLSNSKIDDSIYLKDGKLCGGLFLNLGKMKGLGNITDIPKDLWAESVTLMEGYGYIAWVNDTFYRIYGQKLNEHKSEVKYQFPFLGSESSISINNSLSIPKDGGEWIIVLDNTSLFPFTVSCSDSWISAQPFSSKKNRPYDAISVSIEENIKVGNKTGRITVNSDIGDTAVVQIEQESGDAVLSVSPSKLSFDGLAGSDSLTISSNTDYSISSNKNCCTIDGNIVFVEENATGYDRTAEITVSTIVGNESKTIPVSQNKINLSISQSVFSFSGPANKGSFTVNSEGVSSWDAIGDSEWCSVSKYENTVSFEVSQNNSGDVRYATITVLFPGTKGTVKVEQGIPSLSVSQASFTYDWRENDGQFNVYSDVSDWTTSCDADWVSIEKKGDTIHFTLKENNNTSTRKTDIVTSLPDGRNVTTSIIQEARFIDVSDQSVAADVTSYSFEVKSNIKWRVSVSSGLTLLSDSINDKDGIVTIGLNQNTSQNIKTYTVYFRTDDSSLSYLNKQITITQRKVGRWFKTPISELQDQDIIVLCYPGGKRVGAKVYMDNTYRAILFEACQISNNEITQMPSGAIKIKLCKNGSGYNLMVLNARYSGISYSGRYLCPVGNYKLDFNTSAVTWYINGDCFECGKSSIGTFNEYYVLKAFNTTSGLGMITCRAENALTSLYTPSGSPLEFYRCSDDY